MNFDGVNDENFDVSFPLLISKSSNPDNFRPREFKLGRLTSISLSLNRNIVHGKGSSI